MAACKRNGFLKRVSQAQCTKIKQTKNGLSERCELFERVSLAQSSQIKKTKQIKHGACDEASFASKHSLCALSEFPEMSEPGAEFHIWFVHAKA